MKRGGVIIGLFSAVLLLIEVLGYFVVGCDRGPMPHLPAPQVEGVRL